MRADEIGVAARDDLACNLALQPLAGDSGKVRHRGVGELVGVGALQDRACQRVLAAQLQPGGHAEQKFFRTFGNSMFREDIETETMYYEIALACEGYLYRCFQKGQIDIGRMEEEFDVLIKHWKKVYLRRWK